MDRPPFQSKSPLFTVGSPIAKLKISAWTLMEMLVAIVIIVILAALVIPALSSALERGKAAKCMANMRSIGVAVAAYASENDGRFPRGGWGDGGNSWSPPVTPGATLGWLVDIWSYIGKSRDIFVCPAAEQSPTGQVSWTWMPESTASTPRYPMHYAYNAQLNSNRDYFRANGYAVDRLSGVPRISGLPVLIDIVFQNNFYGGIANVFDANASQSSGTSFAARHGRAGHVLWGDGRVTAHTLKDWATLPEERVKEGTVFMKRWQFCRGNY